MILPHFLARLFFETRLAKLLEILESRGYELLYKNRRMTIAPTSDRL